MVHDYKYLAEVRRPTTLRTAIGAVVAAILFLIANTYAQ